MNSLWPCIVDDLTIHFNLLKFHNHGENSKAANGKFIFCEQAPFGGIGLKQIGLLHMLEIVHLFSFQNLF